LLITTSLRIIKAISPINVEKLQVMPSDNILNGAMSEAIWTLAPSPSLAMKEEHPEDAEIIRRLRVLAEEKS
jgi:hypothetical protein